MRRGIGSNSRPFELDRGRSLAIIDGDTEASKQQSIVDSLPLRVMYPIDVNYETMSYISTF